MRGNPIPALALATCAVGTQTFVFAGLLIELAADLSISVATAGYLAVAYAITYALTAPLIALKTGRLERRRMLWLALLGLSLINLLAALAGSFSELIGLRILAGLAATLVMPVVPPIIAALLPVEKRGQALAMVTGGMVLAFLLGMPLGSLIGQWFDWRATFLLAAVLCLAAALINRLSLPVVQSEDGAGWHLLAHGWQPDIRRLLLMSLAAFSATFCVIPYIAPVMQNIVGSTEQVAFSQMLVGVGALIGITIAARLGNSSSPNRVLVRIFMIIAMTQALYSVAMLVFPEQGLVSWLSLGAAVLFGAAALFALTPLVQAQLLEAAPGARQVTVALNGSVMFLGQGLGAALGAWVSQLLSLQLLGLTGMLVALLGALCAWQWQTPNAEPVMEKS
ncbi:MFS transporter [Pseudomonas jilinensis]|uniref:MFS transporter n=1 Tax=Pseudomonas jilinensis TaxID=2078689 RepID=A0A396RZY5_9PSED|nr:MFS transporter [Pseudomonas jilinensis]RHW22204.1 MFS transporter [Pseudomonas jilinensis]